MLTWLTMFIQKIEGSNLVLIIIGAMWLLYLGFFFVVKANRGKQKIKTAIISEINYFYYDFFKSISLCMNKLWRSALSTLPRF